MPVVFISYRRSDASAYARLLYQELTRAEGIDVFMDVDSIALATDFVEEVRRALERCDVTLAVIGPRWLTVEDRRGRQRLSFATDHVRVELKVALESGGVVLPVLVGDAVMPEPEELPDELAALSHRSAITVHDDDAFKGDIERLVRFVHGVPTRGGAARETVPAPMADAAPPTPANAETPPGYRRGIAMGAEDQARTQAEIIGLQADLRRMHTAREWSAVIALGQQLAKQDPRLADPDGLVTAAQAKLADASSRRRHWLGGSALVTGGLVLASSISLAIENDAPSAMVLGLCALPLLVGWILLLLRPRSRIGAAVTGISAAAWLIFAGWLIPHIDGDMSPLFLVLSICSALAAVVLSILVTPDRVETGEIPGPSSSRRRWLGSSAVVTSGLVLALGTYNSLAIYPIVLPLLALLFLVGWLLLRSRPRIGAAVTGISAAAWSLFAVWIISNGGSFGLQGLFLVLSICSALAAVVLSILVIRSPWQLTSPPRFAVHVRGHGSKSMPSNAPDT